MLEVTHRGIGLVNPIKYAGSYTINDNLVVAFQAKPNYIHRFFTKLLLGWEWKDE